MKPPKPLTTKAARKAYLDWQRGPQIGCSFARRMARNPEEHQRHVQVVTGSVAATVATALDRVISAAVANPDVTSAALILPGVTKLDVLATMALELGSKPSWAVKQSLLPTTPAGPLVAFHMTRRIPFEEAATCPSEALVLGDFLEFPNTRRAPITALEIFVGVPMRNDPKTGKPSTRANLAHITLPHASTEAFTRAWDSAERGRAESLGVPLHVAEKDDVRAKAKVSFVIPPDMAQHLGCHP